VFAPSGVQSVLVSSGAQSALASPDDQLVPASSDAQALASETASVNTLAMESTTLWALVSAMARRWMRRR
jgi:hypothetical protein